MTAGPGEIWFDFTPGEGGVELSLQRIPAQNPLRNIRILRADRIALWEQGQLFNPDWLSRLQGSRVIRFMDWMQANGATHRTTDDLPRLDDFSWAWRGTPPEVMVALANELGAEPWLTLPWQGDKALNQAYARVVKDQLRPGLRAWIEYSNEAWNMSFPQAHGLEAEARARWGQDWKWMQYYGLRAAEMVAAWNEVFADQPERLVRVLSSQTGWLGLEEDLLKAPLLVAEGLEPPVRAFDAWAVSGYFSAGVGHADHSALMAGWLDQGRSAALREAGALGLSGDALAGYVQNHRFRAALAPALEELLDGRHSGETMGSLKGVLEQQWPWHAKVAQAHDLQLVMYEGGSHAVGMGQMAEDPEVTAFLAELSYSPGMAQLYRQLIDGWQAVTAAPFLAYVDVMPVSRYGNWGALRHLWDDNPRWRAISTGSAGE